MAKKRVKRKDWTPEYRKTRRKRCAFVWLSIFCVLVAFFGGVALVSAVGTEANMKKILAMKEVGCDIDPVVDEQTGVVTFVTDEEFRVMQLTDVHIGGGAFSLKKDGWAIDAIQTLVERNKPDLIIITGDIAYPVPFQAGTFNNLREAKVFATLMEQLGVYWAPTFGNHDTEYYSMYNREDISEFYSDPQWEHCLFQTKPSVVNNKLDGYGNYSINVENTSGIITHSFFMFDSHSYTNGDILGVRWEYDNIKQNQIDWYKAEVNRYNAINATLGNTETIKSSMYFHIPLAEYRDAWMEYYNNGQKDTANVQHITGLMGESGKFVYCGVGEDKVFETIQELGSTKWVFCGHDHYNNFTLKYKDIYLTYGMSIDYLAYAGIKNETSQRGATIIDVQTNGEIEITQDRLVK